MPNGILIYFLFLWKSPPTRRDATFIYTHLYTRIHGAPGPWELRGRGYVSFKSSENNTCSTCALHAQTHTCEAKYTRQKRNENETKPDELVANWKKQRNTNVFFLRAIDTAAAWRTSYTIIMACAVKSLYICRGPRGGWPKAYIKVFFLSAIMPAVQLSAFLEKSQKSVQLN